MYRFDAEKPVLNDHDMEAVMQIIEKIQNDAHEKHLRLINYILGLTRQIVDKFQVATYDAQLPPNETNMYLISADLNQSPYSDKNQTILIHRTYGVLDLTYWPEKIKQDGSVGTTIWIGISLNSKQEPWRIEVRNNESIERGQYNWTGTVWGWKSKLNSIKQILPRDEIQIMRVLYLLEAAAAATEFEMLTLDEYYNI